ncbi:MAG: hypothetical protein ACP5HZ_08890 [Ferrimicrobium sp.]
MDTEVGEPHAQIRKAADFLDLAGSVPVPDKWIGADWSTLRAAAWAQQIEDQLNHNS